MAPLKLFRRQLATSTHEVFNQASLLGSYNMFKSDPILSSTPFIEIKYRSQLKEYGAITGSSHSVKHAMLAEKNKPILQQFDVHGRRVDVVDYHDSYHFLMDQALKNGVSGFGHAKNTTGSHIARAALIYMENLLEPGQ